jgi:hypothetical protein
MASGSDHLIHKAAALRQNARCIRTIHTPITIKIAENVREATAGTGSTRHMVEPALLKRPSGQALHELRPPNAAPKVFLGQAAHAMELVPTENLPGDTIGAICVSGEVAGWVQGVGMGIVTVVGVYKSLSYWQRTKHRCECVCEREKERERVCTRTRTFL